MMGYKFTMVTLPGKKSGYHLPAYTEGPLEVVVNGRTFVRIDDALLVEFAIVLLEWLRNQPSDLYYASMDFEEEPVFALKQKAGAFEASSVWAIGEAPAIGLEDGRAAARGYLEALRGQLRHYGADLDAVIAEAVAADP